MEQHRNRGLLIVLASVLLGVGVLMVHSASITSRPSEFEQVYLSRHVVFLSLAIAAATTCACLPAQFWWRAAPYVFGFAVALLVAVLLPGVGTRVGGAQRWLRYGPLSLQPSELAKIALPLFICRLIAQDRSRETWRPAVSFAVVASIGLIVALVLVEPDLGTALFLALGAGIALFMGGWPLRNFAISSALAVPVLAYLISTKPYQLRRITGFVSAWADSAEAPYQIKQSLLSLSVGGLTGVGLGRGWQKLSFLPEANTDFVFAVLGEELGLVGTIGLLAIWLALYLVGLRLLRPLPRGGFAYIAGLTLLTQLVLQAELNIAVATAMAPSKGIPHPLISYGGSNLMVSLLSLGIFLSLSRDTSIRETSGGNLSPDVRTDSPSVPAEALR